MRRRALIGGKKPPIQLVKELNSTNWTDMGYATNVTFNNGVCSFLPLAKNGGVHLRNYLGQIASHKYFYSATVKADNTSNVHIRYCGGAVDAFKQISTSWQVVSNIYTARATGQGGTYLSSNDDSNYSLIAFKNFIFIDLTATYGEGSEPTTVEQFRQDYPDDYYPYNPI